MPKIKVLDKQVAELIAAGEVVERPSSVIKELVENAVDAGASVITVEIRHGGISYMRVTDNGCGIEAQDVPTAFLRHATSKIIHENDLESIMTLGFRGEALASISAVAHVELLTRAKGTETGVRYVGGGGEDYMLEEAGCPEGTTILVRDLFYNTPARMKFLKKDTTEGNSIAGILDKIALSHPEVSFRFIRDGKELLHTPGDSKLYSAIYAVYGKEFASNLIPVDYELNHVRVSGFVSSPAGSRPNRTMQNFFINGRFIRSRTAMAAMEEAFKGSVMVGKFPACVLHLGLSFSAVDVNVHPAKLEVRFVNERPIFDAVYHGVKSALNKGDRPKAMELKKILPSPYTPVLEKQEQTVLTSPFVKREDGSAVRQEPAYTATLRESDGQGVNKPTFTTYVDRVLEIQPRPEPISQDISEVIHETNDVRDILLQEIKDPSEHPGVVEEQVVPMLSDFHSRIIGEAFGTYIIVEYNADTLMLIDKHAAHERLLYEKLKAEHNGCESQALLAPVPVTLDKDEYTAVLSHSQELYKAGFEIEDYGMGSVIVRGIPMILDGGDAADVIMEIAGYLASFKTTITTEHLDWVYHNVACRGAMKAGDTTTREELISLAESLEKNPEVRYCPHGRPVYILLRRREIERQFGRV